VAPFHHITLNRVDGNSLPKFLLIY